jgi:hypothetical protein
MNVIAILGPSRGGKAALNPYLCASKQVDLPFNTPDLDWFIESHNRSHITDEGFCNHVSIYTLTYSWYSFMGRHINLRTSDYYAANNLKPHVDMNERFLKTDSDESFSIFLEAVAHNKLVPCFHMDISNKQFQLIKNSSDINYMPIYSRRSPFDLLRGWLVGNRLGRSKSLGRMMKYGSVPAKSSRSLLEQFSPVLGLKEITVDEKGIFTFHKLASDKSDIDGDNVNKLIDMVVEEYKCGLKWENAGRAIRFEDIVTAPDKVEMFLSEYLGLEFCPDLLPEAYNAINLRSLSEALTTDLKIIEIELNELHASEGRIRELVALQAEYVEYFK